LKPKLSCSLLPRFKFSLVALATGFSNLEAVSFDIPFCDNNGLVVFVGRVTSILVIGLGTLLGPDSIMGLPTNNFHSL
jgi:hypothetical protein